MKCAAIAGLIGMPQRRGRRHHASNVASPTCPVNATEIAIYAVETKAIIHILWGLLLIASASLVAVSITYVLLRIRMRSARRRESQLARHVATQKAEVTRLEERVAALAAVETEAAAMKAHAKRAKALRAKSEERLVAQNAELEALREQLAGQEIERAHLRAQLESGDAAASNESRKAA